MAGAGFSLAVSASAAGEGDFGPPHPSSVLHGSVHAALDGSVLAASSPPMGPYEGPSSRSGSAVDTGGPSDGPASAVHGPASPPLSHDTASAADGAAAIRAAIEKANADWLSALRREDGEAMASFYAPAASLFPPGSTRLEGPERIVAFFQGRRREGLGDPSLRTVDVVPMGDVAYEVGVYGTRFDAGDSDLVADAGRYFAIWKVQADGTLRYQVGIWTSNRAGSGDLDPAVALRAGATRGRPVEAAPAAEAVRALSAAVAGSATGTDAR